MEKREYIVDVSFPPAVEAMKKAGYPELVRCKDCKWHTMIGDTLLCTSQDTLHTYAWFCGDGEKED